MKQKYENLFIQVKSLIQNQSFKAKPQKAHKGQSCKNWLRKSKITQNILLIRKIKIKISQAQILT